MWSRAVGLSVYDFDLRTTFACRSIVGVDEPICGVVARIGAFQDHDRTHAEMREIGIELLHTPEQHLRASTLPGWHPRIAELTARSVVYDAPPAAEDVERDIGGFPVFVKGERQTHRHRRSMAIARDARELAAIVDAWSGDRVLGWQRMVCRELLPLRSVADEEIEDRLPTSRELRTFFWRGELVGHGAYWWDRAPYSFTADELDRALALAREAAARVDVPFLVVDVAQAIDDRFVVIECNDAQESGYARVERHAMWARIVEIERAR